MICTGNIQIMTNSFLDEVTLQGEEGLDKYPIENLQRESLWNKYRVDHSSDIVHSIMGSTGAYAPVSGFSIHGHNLTYGATLELGLFVTYENPLGISSTAVVSGTVYNVTFGGNHLVPPADGRRYGAVFACTAAAITAGAPETFIAYSTYVSDTVLEIDHQYADVIDTAVEAILLSEVYGRKEDAIPVTYGWGEQPWGLEGWGGYSSAKKLLGYITYWFDDILAQYVLVNITDPDNTDGYVEAGRILLGNALTPVYNIEYGAGVNYLSQTVVKRTRAGGLLSDTRPSYRTLDFSLPYLSEQEGLEILDMMDNPSNKGDTLIALYPENKGGLGEVTTVLGRFISHSPLVITPIGQAMTGIRFEEGL